MDSRSPSTMFLFSLLALQTPIQAPHKYWGFSTLQMHYFTFFFFSWYFGQKPLFATQHLTKTHLINCKKKNKLMQTEGKKILRWLQPLCNPYSVQCNLAPQCNQCVIVRPPPKESLKGGKLPLFAVKMILEEVLTSPSPEIAGSRRCCKYQPGKPGRNLQPSQNLQENRVKKPRNGCQKKLDAPMPTSSLPIVPSFCLYI